MLAQTYRVGANIDFSVPFGCSGAVAVAIIKERLMSGLLALLDDVAALAKVAAASVDDIAAAAVKASSKAAGVVIDDAAVTPKYIHGFDAKRELPIIWRIAKGSLKNKLIILLPVALLLSTFLPAAITPLLMIGGAYLCFEGAEKVYHVLFAHGDPHVENMAPNPDQSHLEEERVAGAIKTDFILSAEIMTIALAQIPPSNIWMEAITLAIVGIAITVAVYGSVALIVKMDDIGLFFALRGRFGVTRALGRGLVLGMPKLLRFLSTLGTAAMLWVGGSIIIHGLEVLGFTWLGHHIHDWAYVVGQMVPASVNGFIVWLVKAALDGVFGLVLGVLLIPVATRVVGPILKRFAKQKKAAH
jgi:predicted DNA repair protein MutK